MLAGLSPEGTLAPGVATGGPQPSRSQAATQAHMGMRAGTSGLPDLPDISSSDDVSISDLSAGPVLRPGAVIMICRASDTPTCLAALNHAVPACRQ